MSLLKICFLELYFEVFEFGLVMFDSFDPKADMHIANVNQRINDMLFIVFIKMSSSGLCLNLLKVRI